VTESTVVTKKADGSVAEVAERLTGLLKERSITVFAVIDQAAAAREAGLELRDTVLVLFGNPAAGTPVMAAAPLAAVDLPLKVLLFDDGGRTTMAYRDPVAAAVELGAPPEAAARLGVIHALTDALADA
jgi:uncharacterized protein (DUF302 family)